MNKTNLLVDIGIFTFFLISAAPHLTGNLIHEWLGVALAFTLIVHILLHWDWITTVGIKFFKNLWQVSRLQFLVDILIFAVFLILITSGIAMSKNVVSTLGFQITPGHSWKMIHSTVSNLAVILTGIHIALNWSCIASSINRLAIRPILTLLPSRSGKQVPEMDTMENK